VPQWTGITGPSQLRGIQRDYGAQLGATGSPIVEGRIVATAIGGQPKSAQCPHNAIAQIGARGL